MRPSLAPLSHLAGLALALTTVLSSGTGCSGRACEAGEGGHVARRAPAPPRPSACTPVAAEPGALVAALAAAPDGATLCLAPGMHTGPITIARRVHVWGPADAVVTTGGHGSVITVRGAGARLEGFTVDGIGGVFDRFDAAVHVMADDVGVTGLTIVNPTYGILVEKVRRASVRGNRIEGDGHGAMGLRGDTIRLWETHDSIIADNEIHDGRDMVVWYSTKNRIVGNRLRGGRYGTHFMYSHDNVVEDNVFRGGVVGVFVMYSRKVTLRGNLLADMEGAGGMGIGLKDSSDVVLEDNLVVRGTTGVYIDQTPGDVGATLAVRGNVVRQCDTAVAFHTTPQRTEFAANDFADNLETFRASTGTDPRVARWDGNFYDTYAGYDLDGDGRGDMPFEWQSASEDLIASHPDVAFFRGSPVLGMLDAGSRLLPLGRPRVLMNDPRPRMAAHDVARWSERLDLGALEPLPPRAPALGAEPSTEMH